MEGRWSTGERGEGRGEFFKGGKMGGNYTTMVNILQLKKGLNGGSLVKGVGARNAWYERQGV